MKDCAKWVDGMRKKIQINETVPLFSKINCKKN